MSPSQIFAFLLPTLALNLTPGPDMFFVINQGARGGLRGALKAVTGLWLGYLFHILLVSMGVAALFLQFPWALLAMKFLGGFYLLFLGVRLVASTRGGNGAESGESATLWEGVLVSALNPKVAIFFLAFLPQFLEPGRYSPAHQLIVLGLLFSFTSTITNLGAGILAHSFSRRPVSSFSRQFPLEKVCGVAMVGMALRLALTR